MREYGSGLPVPNSSLLENAGIVPHIWSHLEEMGINTEENICKKAEFAVCLNYKLTHTVRYLLNLDGGKEYLVAIVPSSIIKHSDQYKPLSNVITESSPDSAAFRSRKEALKYLMESE